MKKFLLKATIIFSSLMIFATPASALTAPIAVYREGGTLNPFEHAGVYKADNQYYEIKGYNHTIEISTWASFIDGKSGAYWRNNPSVDSYRSSILSTLASLDADPGITYTMYDQLNYESNPGTYVNVSEISDIRCDGVVEYAYEWNNVWVWGKSSTGTSSGTPTHFDISYTSYVSEHANLGEDEPWIEVSPKVQRGGSSASEPWKWTQFRAD
ncbi:hypothetical protein [Clostridium sp. DJ247]|uniref:hypothetical protein n=1 Tax=Clostridium sp. DJ247 TaxID=2726188 RepID=UPI001629D5F5|nr:hypothetical protein [Clostridium sp. DJ247]MBC2581540.1 hypothetical protein [Clostridium sp. DJ247]